MGLDMFLFSVEKGKEKYLVDNKRNGEFIPQDAPRTDFVNLFIDNGDSDRQLGGKLLPYNLVIPGCDNPGQYHQSLCYCWKRNAIHNWFIKNVQGGIDDDRWHKVSLNDLKQLKKICETVIAHSEIPYSVILDNDAYYSQLIKDSSVAEKLLPTLDGVFFGGIEYDGYYLEYLKDTVKDLEKILAETDFDKVTVFYNSWS